MKTIITAVVVLSVTLAWMPSTTAQENANRAVPVEFFQCNFQKGKGMKDLERVNEKFRAWADKHDMSYSAWVVTPQFHSGLDFELGWMGAWTDGKSFGKGQDAWMNQGADMAEDFNDVIDCSVAHELVSSVVINAPDGPPGDGLVMFSRCNLNEGRNHREALEAHMKLSAAMQEMGSTAAAWLFYPGLGAAADGPDYWRVIAFNNYTELGAASEIMINGGGWQKSMEIMGPVAQCGSPALFDATLVRAGPGRN